MKLKKLTLLRERDNISIEELAIKLNVKSSDIISWENGTKLIYSDMLIKLMDIFDVTCDYLLERTDEE